MGDVDGGGIVNRSDVRYVKWVIGVALLVLVYLAVVGTNDEIREWLEPGVTHISDVVSREEWNADCDATYREPENCYWMMGRDVWQP